MRRSFLSKTLVFLLLGFVLCLLAVFLYLDGQWSSSWMIKERHVLWASCSSPLNKNRFKVLSFDPDRKHFLLALEPNQSLPSQCHSVTRPQKTKVSRALDKLLKKQSLKGSNFFLVQFYEIKNSSIFGATQEMSLSELKHWLDRPTSVYARLPQEVGSFQMIITHNVNSVGQGDLSQLQGTESGTWALQTQSVWDQGVLGAGELMSFADTGLNMGSQGVHEDLVQQFVGGASYVPNESDWIDYNGHGSNVVGLALGGGVHSAGAITGVAPMSQFLVQNVWSKELNNFYIPSDLVGLFYDAYQAGARIHVNSWGSSQNLGAYTGLAYDFDRFAYEYPDMLFVTAVGNYAGDWNADGRVDPGSVASPATAKNVLSVGASENLVAIGGIQQSFSQLRAFDGRFPVEPLASDHPSNNLQGVAAFSGRGPTQDGRIKPEVLAPGTNLLSTKSGAPGSRNLWGAFNKDYNWTGGTSMAAPLVAGVAALVRQTLKVVHKQAQPSSSLVKAVIMNRAFDLYPGQFGLGAHQEIPTQRPNVVEGFGLVQADESVFINPLVLVDEKVGVQQGQSKTYNFELNQNSSLSLSLVWTDYPSQPGSSKTLVNNLDLQIVDQTGRQVLYNDATNNFEHVDLTLNPGKYQLRVLGQEVPVGPQSYALILSLRN